MLASGYFSSSLKAARHSLEASAISLGTLSSLERYNIHSHSCGPTPFHSAFSDVTSRATDKKRCSLRSSLVAYKAHSSLESSLTRERTMAPAAKASKRLSSSAGVMLALVRVKERICPMSSSIQRLDPVAPSAILDRKTAARVERTRGRRIESEHAFSTEPFSQEMGFSDLSLFARCVRSSSKRGNGSSMSWKREKAQVRSGLMKIKPRPHL